MILSYAEVKWLNSRGGRTFEDVHVDDIGHRYICMTNGKNEDVRVYLPGDRFIPEGIELKSKNMQMDEDTWCMWSIAWKRKENPLLDEKYKQVHRIR